MISILRNSKPATVIFVGLGWLVVLMLLTGKINIADLFGY